MSRDPFIITFAGVVGSSKTPIATYLSWNLRIPLFNNDAIRSEVQEDFGHGDEAELRRRRDDRLREIIDHQLSFIHDCSVDREWGKYRTMVLEKGYRFFIISLDLSKPLLLKFYRVKGYLESKDRLDQLFREHEQFVQNHNADINLHITDSSFARRLQLSLEVTREWLSSLN